MAMFEVAPLWAPTNRGTIGLPGDPEAPVSLLDLGVLTNPAARAYADFGLGNFQSIMEPWTGAQLQAEADRMAAWTWPDRFWAWLRNDVGYMTALTLGGTIIVGVLLADRVVKWFK